MMSLSRSPFWNTPALAVNVTLVPVVAPGVSVAAGFMESYTEGGGAKLMAAMVHDVCPVRDSFRVTWSGWKI